MAPEQLRGAPIDARVDQFAWGVMAYELLAGPPWRGTEVPQVVAEILAETPPLLSAVAPEVPAVLGEIVARAMAKDPSGRFDSMEELAAALGGDRAAKDRAVVVPVSGDPRGAPRFVPAAQPDLGTAPTEPLVNVASAPAPADVPRHQPPRAPSRRRRAGLFVGAGLVGAVALLAVLVTRRDVAPGPPGAPVSSGLTPSAGEPSEPLAYPCAATEVPRRDTEGARRVACGDDAAEWCGADGRVLACCAKGLIPRGTDGLCGCPPPTSFAPSACPRADDAGLATADVRAVFGAAMPVLARCYEGRAVDAGGEVTFYLEVDPHGRVFHARVARSSFSDVGIQRCWLGVVRGLRFPPPPKGTLSIAYPVQFAR